MAVRITCINKDSGNHENPYVAISTLGWINEQTGAANKSSREDMYKFVKDGGRAYVKDAYGSTSDLVAEISPRGTRYVKTKPDSTTTDNLLKLMECK